MVVGKNLPTLTGRKGKNKSNFNSLKKKIKEN